MTLILENTDQIEFYTDLYEIIKPFEKEFSQMNWLLTNQEYMIFDYEQKGVIDKLDHESDKITFQGEELLEIIKTRKIQFIWAVFCGFKNNIPDLKDSDLPYADLNSKIWKKPDRFLLKQSEIEIISFDGTAVIFKTKNISIEEKFRQKFTDSKELKKNKNVAQQQRIVHARKGFKTK